MPDTLTSYRALSVLASLGKTAPQKAISNALAPIQKLKAAKGQLRAAPKGPASLAATAYGYLAVAQAKKVGSIGQDALSAVEELLGAAPQVRISMLIPVPSLYKSRRIICCCRPHMLHIATRRPGERLHARDWRYNNGGSTLGMSDWDSASTFPFNAWPGAGGGVKEGGVCRGRLRPGGGRTARAGPGGHLQRGGLQP